MLESDESEGAFEEQIASDVAAVGKPGPGRLEIKWPAWRLASRLLKKFLALLDYLPSNR